MFTDIGDKIKVVAQIFCWIGIIACIIVGIVMIASDEEMLIPSGWVILIGGSLSSIVASFIMYGFGELISNSNIIAMNTSNINNATKTNSIKNKIDDLIRLRDQGSITNDELEAKISQLEIKSNTSNNDDLPSL